MTVVDRYAGPRRDKFRRGSSEVQALLPDNYSLDRMLQEATESEIVGGELRILDIGSGTGQFLLSTVCSDYLPRLQSSLDANRQSLRAIGLSDSPTKEEFGQPSYLFQRKKRDCSHQSWMQC